MSSEKELRGVSLELMGLAHPAYLTTIDKEGFPQTRAMFNLRNKKMFPKLTAMFEDHKEDFMILFTTNTSSPKIQDLQDNQAVSVYYCEPDNWRGVHFGGTIEIIHDFDLKKAIWHEGWEKYYPKGYDDPDHTLLKLYPTVARGWNQSHTFRIDLG